MKNFMTRKSHLRILDELKQLREVDMIAVSREKLKCAEQGDLRENFGYEDAKRKLEMIQNQILQMNEMLAGVQFIDELPIPGDMVSVGTSVKILYLDDDKEEEYHILGPADSDIDKKIISFQTPLAKGLITKKAGETVTLTIPEGEKKVKILKVEKFRFEE